MDRQWNVNENSIHDNSSKYCPFDCPSMITTYYITDIFTAPLALEKHRNHTGVWVLHPGNKGHQTTTFVSVSVQHTFAGQNRPYTTNKKHILAIQHTIR